MTFVSNRSVVDLIITRLLDNAMQHAEGCKTSISWQTNASGLELHVDDAGEGIPETERDRIFDRHYRFQSQKHSDTSGTGLGLALVRLYANSVNAKTVCTESPLGGARFTVMFPANPGTQKILPGEAQNNTQPKEGVLA